MDAQTLFREGVLALRDQKDTQRARQLLTESLKLDPANEMAWLWLSRTTDDPQKKLQCVERALRINPQSEQALALRAKLNGTAVKAPPAAPPPPARSSVIVPLTSDQDEIAQYLAAADAKLKADDAEGAIEQWVNVLDLQADHPVAIQNAVRELYKLGYKEDATELITRAIDGGTKSIPIYLTGIDLARVQGDHGRADDLREQVALMPNADDAVITKMVDHFINAAQPRRAVDLLGKALETHANSQPLLLKMGELQETALGDLTEAALFYERAARIKGGKKLDKALSNFTPIITDHERGSLWMAVREAAGFGVVFLLMGWQDAGLNLLRMGAARWMGVLLSLLGGYLLVTGLSSPQQQPLAAWLGGKVPDPPPPPPKKPAYDLEPDTTSGPIEEPSKIPIIPDALRVIFAIAGVVILIGAFILVFSMSIQLLRHPGPTNIPSIEQLMEQP